MKSFNRETIRNTWRQKISQDKKLPRKPQPNLHRDLSHGWLLPFLLENDSLLWGRWDYWAELMQARRLPERPIPQIEWLATEARRNPAHKMLDASLNAIPAHGTWQTWGSWNYFEYLLDWLLFGFGYAGQPQPPREPSDCEGASDRLYQVFSLEALQVWPYDYFGDILAENKHGRGLGFYPTPLNVCILMAEMMAIDGGRRDKVDLRTQTVCDPCLGSGRMLLVSSNWSLRLYGMDINPTVIKASLANGYLYAPWLVKPIPWLDSALNNPQQSAALSDEMVGVAAGHPAATTYLANTEHDAAQQPHFEPIKKRRQRQPELTPAA